MGADKSGPVELLSQLLRKAAGPPSFQALVARIGDTEGFEEFVCLVRAILPEHEAEILAQPTIQEQVEIFVNRFEPLYFPLMGGMFDWDWVECYHDFCAHLPVEPHGIGYEEYDDFSNAGNTRPGVQLSTYIFEDPFTVGSDEMGRRVALAEACAQLVPQALLEKIPAGGWGLDQVRAVAPGTHYAGLMQWGNILNSATDTFFLDCDRETHDYNPIEWSLEAVQELTLQWQAMEQVNREWQVFCEWLEADLVDHFTATVSFLTREIKKLPKEAPAEEDDRNLLINVFGFARERSAGESYDAEGGRVDL